MPKMSKYNLIIPVGMKPKPDPYEETIAEIMAEYFKSNIRFVTRSSSITPDMFIIRTRQYWEIKNIRGNSKRTIQNNLREADSQSQKVVIGLFRTTMHTQQVIGRIKECLRKSRVLLKSIIVVTKDGKILVIK